MPTQFVDKKTASAQVLDLPNAAGIAALSSELVFHDGTAVRTMAKDAGRAPVSATASTLAVTEALHAGKIVVLNRAAGITVTLPAATGSGNRYRFYNVVVLSGTLVFQTASAADYMRGAQYTSTDNGSGAGLTWPTANTPGTVATESDTMTWNGDTKGGLVGDYVEFVDIAAAVWSVKSFAQSTGTEATPFTAAV